MGKIDEKLENLKNDISRLDKKQDKYNGVLQRTYQNASDIAVLKEQIKVGNHRINDLEDLK